MRVDEVIDTFSKSGTPQMVVKDSTRSDTSMYMSLRKYIARHKLNMSVHLHKGDIVLRLHDSKTSGTD